MAVTVLSQPETYPSASNDMWWVVTSTNVGQPNFKYIFDIYINSTLITRLRIFSDLNSNGIVDVSSVVRNYLYSYFKPNTTQGVFAYTGSDNKVEYTIQFGEEYGGVTYSNLSSATANAYNYYQPIFRNWSTDYYNTFSWLTNRDKSFLQSLYNNRLFITYRQNTAASITVSVQRYNADGTPFGSPSTASNSSGLVTILDVSPAAINTTLGTTFILDSTPFYGIKIGTGEELFIIPNCSNRYNNYNVHFLNSLGGYETYQFYLANRLSSVNQRKSFERMEYQINGSNQMKNYNQYNVLYGGGNSYAVRKTVSIKLQTDMLSFKDYNWFSELINSTEAYLEYNNFFYPIVIKTTNWEEKYKQDKQNKVLTLDADLMNINSQYR